MNCPRCNGLLVEKMGAVVFWGCSNFPVCTFAMPFRDGPKEEIPREQQDLIDSVLEELHPKNTEGVVVSIDEATPLEKAMGETLAKMFYESSGTVKLNYNGKGPYIWPPVNEGTITIPEGAL